MKKLCFGPYASVLVRCMAPTTTQKQLVGTMLLSVNSLYDICDDDAAVSSLVLGRKNLSNNIIVYAKEAAPSEVAAAFRTTILPLLDMNKCGNIVLALRTILAEDTEIPDDTKIELVNGLTKSDICTRDSFVLHELLAGMFLYTAIYTGNNKREKEVREITDAFIRSFDKRRNEVSFIPSYSLKNDEEIATVAADAKVMVLMAECSGTCPRCGKILTCDNSTVMDFNSGENMLLCLECAGKVQSSVEEKAEMIRRKERMQEHYDTRDAISANRLSGEIKELLALISKGEPLTESALRMIPLKVEQKISEKQLLRKILNNVVDGMYEMVNDAIEQLAAENKINVKEFRRSIKRMFEDAEDTAHSQSDIFNELVQYLYARSGMKYYEACEILISYFVQSCEVFHEITF